MPQILTAMRKKLSLLIFTIGIFSCLFSSAQLSVSFSEKENVIGIAVGPTNNNGERDRKAYEDCQRKGGTYCRTVPVNPLLVMAERYGCYAIVQGKTKDGITVTGCYDMSSSQAQAAKDATYYVVTFLNALPNSVGTVFQGCLEKPKPTAQPNAAGGSQQQWSEWKTDNCFKGLRYRMKHYTVYDLNKQYHYYFEFVNTYNKTVYFDYNLLDAKGKVRFGNRHTIRAGDKIEFNHKMTSNYITSTQVENLNFDPYSKEYQNCDAAIAPPSPANNTGTHISEADIRELAGYKCRWQALAKKDYRNYTAADKAFEKEYNDYMIRIEKKYPDADTDPEFARLLMEEMQKICGPKKQAVSPTSLSNMEKDAIKWADYLCQLYELMKKYKGAELEKKSEGLGREMEAFEKNAGKNWGGSETEFISMLKRYNQMVKDELKRRGCVEPKL
jgi:hypothetical protein